MRLIDESQYRKKGVLKPVDYNTGQMTGTEFTFNYRDSGGRKQRYALTQQLSGFLMTDEGRTIETVSNLKFQRGDKITLKEGTYEITNIQKLSIEELGMGQWWDFGSREITVITLT